MQYLLTLLCWSGFSLVKALPVSELVAGSEVSSGAGRLLRGNLQEALYHKQKNYHQVGLTARDVDDIAAVLVPRGKRRTKRPQLGNNRLAQGDAVPSGEQEGPRGAAPPLLRSGGIAPWHSRNPFSGRNRMTSSNAGNDAPARPENTQGLPAIRTPRGRPRSRTEHPIDSPSSMYGSKPPSPDGRPPSRSSSSKSLSQDASLSGLASSAPPVKASSPRRLLSSSTGTKSPPGSPTTPRTRFASLPFDERLQKELSWVAKEKWTMGKQAFDGHPHGMTGETILQASGAAPSARQRQRLRGDPQRLSEEHPEPSQAYLSALTRPSTAAEQAENARREERARQDSLFSNPWASTPRFWFV